MRVELEEKIWSLLGTFLKKKDIKNLKETYNKEYINKVFSEIKNKKRKRKISKKAYKLWSYINKNNIRIDRNLYNYISHYRDYYLDNLPSVNKLVKGKLGGSKTVINNWIMCQPYEYLERELNLFRETNDFFKTKNRNTSFWKRDLIDLLIYVYITKVK